jgi:hypothetical protein
MDIMKSRPSRSRVYARPWLPVGQRPGISLYVECPPNEGFAGGVLVIRTTSRLDDHAGELMPVSLSLRDSAILERLSREQTPMPGPPEQEAGE